MSRVMLRDTGIVVIGRNEGERLRRSLSSARGRVRRVVYADSASSDHSPELARAMGAEVVELNMSIPANAARGRNAGFEFLMECEPDLTYCLFIDGDCELVDGFLETARGELERDRGCGIVCGRRRETRGEVSIYNRLVDSEWNTPLGLAEACGGDALVRVAAFRAAGGYNESMSCGEDPEFSYRVRRSGWTIRRLAVEMTRHDVALLHFGPWWKRHGRGGYAYAHGCALHWREPERYNLRTCLSIALYAILLPLATAVSSLFLGLHALWIALLYLRLGWNVAAGRRERGDSPRSSAVYALFVVVGKYSECWGAMRCLFDLALKRRSLVCEYKDDQHKAAA
ncbi:MAG: glycosyl transferase [Planctomycetes bacterium]|nr:glycosyl transferase [Planctomycetota bacterium]